MVVSMLLFYSTSSFSRIYFFLRYGYYMPQEKPQSVVDRRTFPLPCAYILSRCQRCRATYFCGTSCPRNANTASAWPRVSTAWQQ